MSKCDNCGRDDGHWLGCDSVATPDAEGEPPQVFAETCAYGDCTNLRRLPGKGPRPKYCTEHSDPKNRK
jgi:hypothetical protein